uniref:ULP_PROTEASE domain-containing protein n=1 Tax=Panagrellus redivivus TaxID=6233 RepID=A0A7E4W7G2_PANRE
MMARANFDKPLNALLRAHYTLTNEVDFKGVFNSNKHDSMCFFSLFGEICNDTLFHRYVRAKVEDKVEGPTINVKIILERGRRLKVSELVTSVLPPFSDNVWGMFAHILNAKVPIFLKAVVTLFIINILYRLKRLKATHLSYFFAMVHDYCSEHKVLRPGIYAHFRALGQKVVIENEGKIYPNKDENFLQRPHAFIWKYVESDFNKLVDFKLFDEARQRLDEFLVGNLTSNEMKIVERYYKLMHVTPTLAVIPISDPEVIQSLLHRSLTLNDVEADGLLRKISVDIMLDAFKEYADVKSSPGSDAESVGHVADGSARQKVSRKSSRRVVAENEDVPMKEVTVSPIPKKRVSSSSVESMQVDDAAEAVYDGDGSESPSPEPQDELMEPVPDSIPKSAPPRKISKKRSSSSSIDGSTQTDLREVIPPVPEKRFRVVDIKEEIVTEGDGNYVVPPPIATDPVLMLGSRSTSTDSEPGSPTSSDRAFIMARSIKTGNNFKLILPAW